MNPALIAIAARVASRFRGSGNVPANSGNPHIVGSPEIIAAEMDGPQAFSDTCAIKAQEVIIERYTNREISEESLVAYAARRGWYTPGGGTPTSCVGNLVEQAGIPVTRRTGANIFDLHKDLSEGKQIIIGVDGSELRGENAVSEFFEEFYGGPAADHAVVVSGINTLTNQVIITDPATGLTKSYSFERLTEAWSDSDFFMMSTNIPAPKWVPGMEDFDYVAGHVSQFGGLYHEEFISTFSSVLSVPNYSSTFGLEDFLEVIPHAYASLLAEWSFAHSFPLPTDWGMLCMQDQEWLRSIADSAGVSVDLAGADTGEGFFEAAGEIFNTVFG